MRRPIAGNWKMNGLAPQLAGVEAVAASVAAEPSNAYILICAPTTLVARAAQVAAGRIAIGGENCHTEIAGAFTRDVSAEMLKDAGASAVIVGHFERRQHRGETDAIVAAKAKAARRGGFSRSSASARRDRSGGAAAHCSCAAIRSQAPAPDDMGSTVTANGYELLCAIGTGRTSTSKEIIEVHAHVRRCLDARVGVNGKKVRMLYGGSVKPANAEEILALLEVGVALVGGASVKTVDFEAIIGTAPMGT